jgi:hypothetical protein
MNYPMLDDGTRDWCRTCAHYVGACESDCTYQRNENGLDYDKEPTMYQQKPISNADKLRSMSDEELAEFMRKGCDDRECPDISFPADTPFAKDASNEQRRKCWLDWLRQEAQP